MNESLANFPLFWRSSGLKLLQHRKQLLRCSLGVPLTRVHTALETEKRGDLGLSAFIVPVSEDKGSGPEAWKKEPTIAGAFREVP